MAEIWGAVIAGGAALGGAYLSSQGAQKAGNAAAAGSAAAIAEQRREFDLSRMDTAPYRSVGSQAINALGRIYGYTPAAAAPKTGPGSEAYAGAAPVNALAPVAATAPGGKYNIGGSLVASGKLGAIGTLLDPAASIFGSTHGDENRNLKAFAAESGVMQLPDGRYALPNGAIFDQSQLQQVAGTWYGAVHAPDGNQADWQSKYSALISGLGGSSGTPAASGSGNAFAPTPGGGVRPILQATQGPDGTYSVPSTPTGPSTMSVSAQSTPAGPDYSAFIASPDYQFRKQQGTQGIERSAAARGLGASGNALTALADYNSNLASEEFGNYFNRQAALAGIGQTATGQQISAGTAATNGISNALVAGADARASGIGGQYNAWGNAAGTIGGIAYNYFNRPSGYGGSGGYIAPVQISQRYVG